MSVVGLIVMVFRLLLVSASVMIWVSCILFCISLIALYTSSGVYHYFTGSAQTIQRLRKLDHAMIYVLIAGSYTPILLNYLAYPKSVIFTSVIWAIALFGIVAKLFWITMPRALSTIMYILMGWAIVVDLPAVGRMPTGAIVLLVLGGLSYTFGGILYWIKKPNISKLFGFHEVFHLFIMLGSLLHFLMVFLFIVK